MSLLERILKYLKPIRKVSVSEWADSNRQLPSTAAESGKWRTSRVPYLKSIMDAFTEPKIHKVVAMTAAQVGKTECLLNVLGRYVSLDPCNILLIQPTLEMAADISKDRLANMITDTKSLTPLFFGEEKLAKTRSSAQTILSKTFQGGRLVLAGANSATGLASRPIRILLCDEVDRFPESAGNNEGDPVNLAAKRCTTYWNYVIGLFSTPTTEGASRIETEYLQGTQEEWQHACPNCGEYHKLDYRHFFIDGKVKWRCPDCGMDFEEREIKSAAQKYVMKNPQALEQGTRSFWVNAFSSPWLSWEFIMSEWAEAKGNSAKEKVIVNTRFAESYAETGEFADEKVFLNRLESYEAELPEAVRLLTAGVDVQANRLEYEICGWSATDIYKILKGVIWGRPNESETWNKLDGVLEREYFFSNGASLKVARTFIDSGYATKNVYEYCYRHKTDQRFAIKGQGGAGLALLHKYTRLKEPPITLTILGVDDGKQEIFSRLTAEEGKGAIHFPADDVHLGRRGFDEIYFKQLIAEKRGLKWSGGVAKMAWSPIHKHARNEALDTSVYSYAAFKSLLQGKSEAEYFQRMQKKPAPKKHTVKSRSAEIF